MRKYLLVAVLLLGGGCTSVNTPLAQEARDCRFDSNCIMQLLESCQPGTFTDNPNDVLTPIDYTIEGTKDGNCLITWKFKELKADNPFNGLAVTCDFPVNLNTADKVREAVAEEINSRFARCRGPLKDSFLGTLDPNNPSVLSKNRDSKRLSDLKQIQTALEIYYSSLNRYPEGENVILGSGSAACLNASGWQKKGCSESFMAMVPADPGVGNFVYSLAKDKSNYTVTTKLEGEVAGFKEDVVLTNTGFMK